MDRMEYRSNSSSIMHATISSDRSNLFECVAEEDYEGLLHLLASEGLRVLEGCSGGSFRHDRHERHQRHLLQQPHQLDHSMTMTDDGQETKSSEGCAYAMTNQTAWHALMQELTLFLQTTQTSWMHHCGNNNNNNKPLEVSAEAEHLLRESLAALVDARPPPDFVVSTQEGDVNHQQEPPLFDGAVANATPPPLEGGPAGGAGTLMHLATALDQPFVLAILLALGGDARACHTAFRRLLIHEAACNGSVHCLTLLLELGSQCQPLVAAAETPPLRVSLPFLPRRLDRAQALAALPFLAQSSLVSLSMSSVSSALSSSTPSSTTAATSSSLFPSSLVASGPSTKNSSTGLSHILTLLHKVRTLVPEVRRGTMSEIEAARAVLQHAHLKPASQRALARACHFRHTSNNQNTTSSWRGGSLDGHGNTPLHWAAFKNETSCVSLLLAAGADPNARAHPSGWTPLHDAAYSNSVESIELLISAGAMVDARANSGATPLCFAAQEDAQGAVALLLARGANLTTRCAPAEATAANSRFSGYTPLHYCAHYNARNAAVALLAHHRPSARRALEIPDLSDRLPIHVAVARGSAAVLRELLHAGARVETRWAEQQQQQHLRSQQQQAQRQLQHQQQQQQLLQAQAVLMAETTRRRPPSPEAPSTPRRPAASTNIEGNVTPVSSPVLRSMIPSQPVTSAKPWNCLSQQSIDECRHLISQAESCWSPERHALFTPADREAVHTVLLVGQRCTQGVFPEVWREVLSFCGRGWFEPGSNCATPYHMDEDLDIDEDDEDHFMAHHREEAERSEDDDSDDDDDDADDDLRHRASHLSLPRF